MKNIYFFLGGLLTLTGCSSISTNSVNQTTPMTDTLDQYLFQEKVIDAKYRFNPLKDYQTDPIYLKAINNYYGSFPKKISEGYLFESVDFGRNHFFIRHEIDSKRYKGKLTVNNRSLLKQALLDEQCKGLFAHSVAIKKNGGMEITQTFNFVNENMRVVVDMNTLECQN